MTGNPTHAQVRQIGRRWVVTCIECPSCYHSVRTPEEARVKQIKHDRRHRWGSER